MATSIQNEHILFTTLNFYNTLSLVVDTAHVILIAEQNMNNAPENVVRV